MKRERVNDDSETDGINYRNGSGIKYRVISIKQEKSLAHSNTMMPANLSTGVCLNQEDSQSGEDMVLSLNGQNVSQSFVNMNNNSGHIYFMLPSDSQLTTTANQPAVMGRVVQPEVCLLSPDDAESNGVNGLPRRGARDDKRRATHNEVERRRRGKINSSIEQLGNVLPNCPIQQGSKQSDSKGAILSKACDYITDLKMRNDELKSKVSELIVLKGKLKEISQKVDEAREENHLLRDHLISNDIRVPGVE